MPKIANSTAGSATSKVVAERVRINVDKRSMPGLHKVLSNTPLDKQGAVLVYLANTALLLETVMLNVPGVSEHLESMGMRILAPAVGDAGSQPASAAPAVPSSAAAKTSKRPRAPRKRTKDSAAVQSASIKDATQAPVVSKPSVDPLLAMMAEVTSGSDLGL